MLNTKKLSGDRSKCFAAGALPPPISIPVSTHRHLLIRPLCLAAQMALAKQSITSIYKIFLFMDRRFMVEGLLVYFFRTSSCISP